MLVSPPPRLPYSIVAKRSTPHLRRRLDRAAPRFRDHAFVHGFTRDGLLERLKPMTIEARTVLDLGAGPGLSRKALKSRFPKAEIIGVDLSLEMLRRHDKGWFDKPMLVQANAEALPLKDSSIDVVFANLVLPFVDDPAAVANELARVVRPEGVFVLATLGPDTFSELRTAWAALDTAPHVAEFPDMHDVGDALVRAGFADPVLDVDRLRVSYRDAASLFADLEGTGARNALAGRRRGLTTPSTLARFTELLFPEGGSLNLDLELVFGHAFGGQSGDGAVRIDPSSIARRPRR